jgi:Phage stabilisation protein
MQIPILSGIFTDSAADYRTSYPVNKVPVPKDVGVSAGYLRHADGIAEHCTGPGVDRGGIIWDGNHYRVMGTSLVLISESGVVSVLGDVGSGGWVTMDYGFGRLAIASGGRLYYWDGSALTLVTDPDLGTVNSLVWGDGYYLTTDGTYIVQTELTDPTSVNPLKYGSSEADPDGVVALRKVRRELHVLNKHTTEVYQNIGGEFFAWTPIPGAQIQRGCVGPNACAVYMDSVAFVGGGRNEPPGVYIAQNGSSAKLSTREIDTLLLSLTDEQLAAIVVETRTDKAHNNLLVHLPDRCVVYDSAASQVMQVPVWHVLTSGVSGFSTYRAKGLVYLGGKWFAGDPTSFKVGTLTGATGAHYGSPTGWEFGTTIVYNEGRGAIIHALELVALTGRVDIGVDPTIWTSHSDDGMSWGQERPIKAGMVGDRTRRLQWRTLGHMRNVRIQKFRGTSDARLSFSRLEATIEALQA